MAESTPEFSSTQGAGGGSWQHLWGALTAPRETFRALAARPTWVTTLIVLLLAGMLFGFVAMGKITPEDFLRSIEAQGRSAPAAMQENPEKILASMRWIQVGAGTLFAALFYFATAGLFLVLFRLLGSDLSYSQSLATTLHGLLPLGVAAVVGLAIVMGREQVGLDELRSGSLVLSNLGLLAGEETGKVARALLTSLDLFAVWSVALLALGFEVVARVSKGAAWGVVLSLWGVGVGLKAILASIF